MTCKRLVSAAAHLLLRHIKKCSEWVLFTHLPKPYLQSECNGYLQVLLN
jgi:hypothetical protein